MTVFSMCENMFRSASASFAGESFACASFVSILFLLGAIVLASILISLPILGGIVLLLSLISLLLIESLHPAPPKGEHRA